MKTKISIALALLAMIHGVLAQDASTTNAATAAAPGSNLKVLCAMNVHDPARPPVSPRCDKIVSQTSGYKYENVSSIKPWKCDAKRGAWVDTGNVPLTFNIIVPAGDSGKLRLLFWLPRLSNGQPPAPQDITVQGNKFGRMEDALGQDQAGEWVEGTYSADDTKDGKLTVVVTTTDSAAHATISGFEVISTKP